MFFFVQCPCCCLLHSWQFVNQFSPSLRQQLDPMQSHIFAVSTCAISLGVPIPFEGTLRSSCPLSVHLFLPPTCCNHVIMMVTTKTWWFNFNFNLTIQIHQLHNFDFMTLTPQLWLHDLHNFNFTTFTTSTLRPLHGLNKPWQFSCQPRSDQIKDSQQKLYLVGFHFSKIPTTLSFLLPDLQSQCYRPLGSFHLCFVLCISCLLPFLCAVSTFPSFWCSTGGGGVRAKNCWG